MATVKYQVFVSSTYTDLKEERWEALMCLLSMDMIVSGMELFPASNMEQFEYIKRVIDDCDYYLLILGGRYGSVPEGGAASFTEMEFEYARQTGKPIIALLHDKPETLPEEKRERDPALAEKFKTFRKSVSNDRLVAFWQGKEDIAKKLAPAIHQILRDQPGLGWVRGNGGATTGVADERKQIQLRPFFFEKTIPLDFLCRGENEQIQSKLADVFCCIAPDLKDWTNEGRISELLCRKFFGNADKDIWQVQIIRHSLNMVLLTFLAHGLIVDTNRSSDRRPMGKQYRLTEEGMRKSMELLLQ